MMPEFWTLAITLLAALTCGGLGLWLYLGRDSMVGDAVSHGVLPGLVVAFLLFGTRAPLPLLAFGALAGWITTLASDRLRQHARLEPGAALGVAFTAMFALGLLLMHRYAGRVDLDPGAVLYGQLEFASLDRFSLGAWWIPSVMVVQLGGAALVLLAGVLWGCRLYAAAIDPEFAQFTGVTRPSSRALLMALVAAVTVSVFEIVGVIMVIALFVAPAMSAHRFSRGPKSMVCFTLLFAAGIAFAGSFLATLLDVSTAGTVATVAGVTVALCFVATAKYQPHMMYK